MKASNYNLEFENHLIGLEFPDNTIDEHFNNIKYFEVWSDLMQIENVEHLNRADFLEYAKYMDNIPVKTATQNLRLNTMDKFYAFLKLEGIVFKNPVKGFRIKKDTDEVVHNPFSEKDLLRLFADYCEYLDAKPKRANIPSQGATNIRYMLIVSLVIFQGLHTGELDKLTVADVDPNNGSIYIPSTGRSNSRVIPLHQKQMLPFYKYLTERDAEEKLFPTKVQNVSNYILKELQGITIVDNLQHIRASVLLNWIKRHDKRKAQYMIGHKWASTTETYEVQDVSDLAEELEEMHLFG